MRTGGCTFSSSEDYFSYLNTSKIKRMKYCIAPQHLPGWLQTDKSELPQLLLKRRSMLKYIVALQAIVYLAFVRNVDGNSIQNTYSINSFLLKFLKIYVLVNTALLVLQLFWVIFDKDLSFFWPVIHFPSCDHVSGPTSRPTTPLPEPPDALFHVVSWLMTQLPSASPTLPRTLSRAHISTKTCQSCDSAWPKSLPSFLRRCWNNPCLSTANSKVCYLLKKIPVWGGERKVHRRSEDITCSKHSWEDASK